MERVRIFLRTALFTLPGEAGHVPVGATIVEATVTENAGGGLTVKTTKFLDDRGKTLSDKAVVLLIPWSKIDHVQVNP